MEPDTARRVSHLTSTLEPTPRPPILSSHLTHLTQLPHQQHVWHQLHVEAEVAAWARRRAAGQLCLLLPLLPLTDDGPLRPPACINLALRQALCCSAGCGSLCSLEGMTDRLKRALMAVLQPSGTGVCTAFEAYAACCRGGMDRFGMYDMRDYSFHADVLFVHGAHWGLLHSTYRWGRLSCLKSGMQAAYIPIRW